MNNPDDTSKAKPILFTGPMVRAIREGRKRQTRRLVKPQPEKRYRLLQLHRDGTCEVGLSIDSPNHYQIRSPYTVGQELWVRETWRLSHATATTPKAIYRVDDPEVWGSPWKPSIFMPRWASRITLRVTSVRVERLLEMNEGDAIAEGLSSGWFDDQGETPGRTLYWTEGLTLEGKGFGCPVAAYRELWNSINGKKAPWSSNPWVWVIEFERRP